MAKLLRRRLRRQFETAWAVFLELLGSGRGQEKEQIGDERRRRGMLKARGDPKWMDRIRARGKRTVGKEMDELIRRGR